MKYKRLTKRIAKDEEAFLFHSGLHEGIERLAELEDKIERGELISTVQSEQGEQEIEFFVEHNAEERKEAVKECLRILRDIRSHLPRHYGVFWEGWSGAFNASIRAISQKYAVSVEEECGE